MPEAALPAREDRGGPAQPLLIIRDLVKRFPVKAPPFAPKRALLAVDHVSFDILKGETLGIVGESGCGKSTTSRLIMTLLEPTAGELIFDGEEVGGPNLPIREFRRQTQMVFQDSYASLNPRLAIEETIAFAPRVHGMPRRRALERARELLDAVGLAPARFARRFPHQLSGGQRQRVNIARALALDPRLVILDEPVSALDKSVQAQVLNLLNDLKARFGLTYLFISHDLDVVQYISDRVVVMYLGQIVEQGPVAAIYEDARHPYTAALLASRPALGTPRERAPLSGEPPDPMNPPSGCRFRPRCALAEPVCARVAPAPVPVAAGHEVACLMEMPGSGHGRARA
ncbi:MAG: dipeptide/oligopeptide/nickel ABC transporter ATP-binding protein [Rhodovulum sulfidophilum]|uniref:Glutathione import ATP-binding protein GsiA n=1 Tax=Rhodovulum sulfidophilum TaxID=35806 RepID=A0A2W5N2A9_RHOSU|nr:MAG: dipeptide/oligopeptide/nickel ABC transporter ATP-binding protein [Rhodovulum sulfidophilum]